MTLLESLHKHHEPTYEHSRRVAKYSEELASLEGKLDTLAAHDAGFIHDIGKIFIDKSLLELSEISKKQYEEIKKHVKYGYDLLVHQRPFFACIAGKHHPEYAVNEWPEIYTPQERKLVSKYIKIVTFADFFDALITRNNSAYKVNTKNKVEVFAMLKEYFPEREEWMEKSWNVKEPEKNPSEK